MVGHAHFLAFARSLLRSRISSQILVFAHGGDFRTLFCGVSELCVGGVWGGGGVVACCWPNRPRAPETFCPNHNNVRVPHASDNQSTHAPNDTNVRVPNASDNQGIHAPNHNNVRVPSASDDQSIHAQTTMTFVSPCIR